jgi:hypothetical protein
LRIAKFLDEHPDHVALKQELAVALFAHGNRRTWQGWLFTMGTHNGEIKGLYAEAYDDCLIQGFRDWHPRGADPNEA